MAWYFDTSALIKLVSEEAESDALTGAISTKGLVIATSALTVTEFGRAAKRKGPAELAVARSMLANMTDLIPLDENILTVAIALDPPSLRTLDSLHIAAALSLGSGCEGIITYDRRMQEAARAAGFTVLAPGQD